jgi:hypothetical protein
MAFARPANDFVRLNFIARSDAAVAKDARLMIDGDDFRRKVLRSRKDPPSRGFPVAYQAIVSAKGFKLAIAGGPLASAGNGVFGEEKRREHSSMFFDTLAVGLDAHPLFAGPNTGSSKYSAANIDDAHSAHADRPQPWMVA